MLFRSQAEKKFQATTHFYWQTLPISAASHPPRRLPHVRRLERLLIDALSEHGVDGYRVEGRSGVWVRRPLAA